MGHGVAIWAAALALAAALAWAVERRRRHAAQVAVWRDAVRIAELTRAAGVGELAGWVAEEVGTPVASVLNNVGAAVRFLERGSEALPDVTAAVDEARAAGERAAHAIRRMRLMAGADAGRREPVDLNDVAREALRLTRWHAAIHEVRLETSLEPRLPRVLGDPLQLLQMALSVVLAAVDAASGSRERTVRVYTSLAEGGVELAVGDSGPVMSERDRPLLFAPFSRVHAGGLGIGFALTRAIAEAHDGRVTAERPASGALFRVVLPAPEPAASLEATG